MAFIFKVEQNFRGGGESIGNVLSVVWGIGVNRMFRNLDLGV
jgi:hypothetical protein